MKRTKILAALSAAAIVASATTTTAFAEEVTQTAIEELSTTSSSILNANEVWEITSDIGTVTYLCFDTETTGHTIDAELGIGVAFEYEATSDSTYVFHMAEAHDNTEVTITADESGVVHIALGSIDYTARLLNTTAELFQESFYANLIPPYVFDDTVWELIPDGEGIHQYLCVEDAEGVWFSEDDGIGTPLSIESVGSGNFIFHFGSDEDATPVSVAKEPDSTYAITISWEAAGDTGYTMKAVKDENPATFQEKYIEKLYGDVDTAEANDPVIAINETAPAIANAVEISVDEFKAAYTKYNKDVILYTTFPQPQAFELQFNFTTAAGVTKVYTATSNGTKGNVSYIPMQDMLDKLKINSTDIDSIVITGKSLSDVVSFSFDKSTTVETKVPTADNDRNPSTGVGLTVLPMLGAALGAVIFRKRTK